MNTVKYTHRVDSLMLWEAHRSNAVDSDSQNGDEQVDKCDPVGEKRPEEDRRTTSLSICWRKLFNFASAGCHLKKKTESAVIPVIIHVLYLPFDVAVDALAVRPVCESTDHAEPVGSLLFGKQFFNGDRDLLPPLLIDTHNFLFQTHLRLDQGAVFCLPPSSL